mmetsp:Transcript_64095/g.198496  ORF Transcript_64095/g.198496 Transcript_64095/m.198496 type:complete len:242 (-) Transcript_64095:230-955(-)
MAGGAGRSPQGCGGRGSTERGRGELAASMSAPTLPSVSSAYPMRRAPSLSSREASSADAQWQTMLRGRLGSPGEPPGRDALPSLYDPDRAPPRPASGMSRSVPPSSVGPSASIVAWFAQFQCESCGRIPTSLDARFCFCCGQPLPLPELPTTAAAGSACGSRPPDGRAANDAARSARPSPRAEPRDAPRARCRGKPPAAAPARPPRPPAASNADAHPPRLQWKDRESQCAVWLGNIRPRRP